MQKEKPEALLRQDRENIEDNNEDVSCGKNQAEEPKVPAGFTIAVQRPQMINLDVSVSVSLTESI